MRPGFILSFPPATTPIPPPPPDPNLRQWLDSSVDASMVLDVFGNVQTWLDQTANGLNVTQPFIDTGTGPLRPTKLAGAQNGFAGVQFNNRNRLDGPLITSLMSATFTTIIVNRLNGSFGARIVTSTGSPNFTWIYNGGGVMRFVAFPAGNFDYTISPLTDTYAWAFMRTGPLSMSIRNHRGAWSDYTFSSNINILGGSQYLGDTGNTSPQYGDIRLEQQTYNVAKTKPEVDSILANLVTKWALT